MRRLQGLAGGVDWRLTVGYSPSCCTACYRKGRTGDRYMSFVKTGQIANCCAPNSLMTRKEYLSDYASEDTRLKGEAMILQEIKKIPNPRICQLAMDNLVKITEVERDFRF